MKNKIKYDYYTVTILILEDYPELRFEYNQSRTVNIYLNNNEMDVFTLGNGENTPMLPYKLAEMCLEHAKEIYEN